MKAFFKSLFFNRLFFTVFFLIAVFFVVSYFNENLFGIGKLLFYILLVLLVFDFILLYRNKIGIQAERILPEKLSNGDQNPIEILITNRFKFIATIKIIDELPIQFQKRDFEIRSKLKPSEQKKITYK